MMPQAFVTQWWQLAVLRALMGMTLAGLLPSIAKLVRQSVDESTAGTMLGYLQSAQFSGQVIGPLIGGQIGVHLGLQPVFFVTGLVAGGVRRAQLLGAFQACGGGPVTRLRKAAFHHWLALMARAFARP